MTTACKLMQDLCGNAHFNGSGTVTSLTLSTMPLPGRLHQQQVKSYVSYIISVFQLLSETRSMRATTQRNLTAPDKNRTNYDRKAEKKEESWGYN